MVKKSASPETQDAPADDVHIVTYLTAKVFHEGIWYRPGEEYLMTPAMRDDPAFKEIIKKD